MNKRGDRQKNILTSNKIPLSFGLILEVKYSANAWWMDYQKIHSLIAALSIGLTIDQACSYTGISVRQYKYFVKEHPVFSEARRGFALRPGIQAQMTIVKAIYDGDIKTSWKWLEKKYPEEFGRPSKRRGMPNYAIANEGNKFQSAQEMFDEMSPEEKEALNKLRLARKERLKQQILEQPL